MPVVWFCDSCATLFLTRSTRRNNAAHGRRLETHALSPPIPFYYESPLPFPNIKKKNQKKWGTECPPGWTSLNLAAPIESVSYTSATDNQLSLSLSLTGLFRENGCLYFLFSRPLSLSFISIALSMEADRLYTRHRTRCATRNQMGSLYRLDGIWGCLFCPPRHTRQLTHKEWEKGRSARSGSPFCCIATRAPSPFCYFYRLYFIVVVDHMSNVFGDWAQSTRSPSFLDLSFARCRVPPYKSKSNAKM